MSTVTLDHINVCKFVGVVTFPSYYMVSEFMEKGSLDDLLHDSKSDIQWKVKLGFLKDIATGMLYLHNVNTSFFSTFEKLCLL